MPVRLALLICDTPNPGVLADHGDYLEIFTRFFQDSIPDKEIEFVIDGYDVVHKQEYPPADSEYDAVVITGSAAAAYDDIPWITRLISYINTLAKTKPAAKIIGHPEFLPNIVNKIIDVRGSSGSMDAGTVEGGRARAIRPDDGTGIIGRTIWKVIGVESTT
ncbi:hypothetical protein Clacol_007273 [Clathrus columnatus]|uniref:DJ-1/PfpI domain-containing protein n=1 Tax=Clathrus columnatus TaxID=1419009 RepID=A0AAV5AIR4_9AGAM|nr:hypothetical protein Clacol_007273 [Clathrus columnatus]